MSYRTIELKLDLSKRQKAIIDGWMDESPAVWNIGLELLIEHRLNAYYDKLEERSGKSVKRVKRQLARKASYDKEKKLENPLFTPKYLSGKAKGKRRSARINRQSRGLSLPKHTVISRRLKTDNFIGLSSVITNEKYPCVAPSIPAAFKHGILVNLATAWAEYKKGSRKNRNIPRFKSRHKAQDRIDTLYTKASGLSIAADGRIKVPGVRILGSLKTVNHGVEKRWGDREIKALKICRMASGYYIQLTGDFESEEYPESDRAIGIDVGLEYVISTSDNQQVEPPRYYRKQEKRLARLQRKIARQYKDGKNKNGKNLAKTRQKVAKLHEKISRRRRAFNHELTTTLVKNNGAIAVEDLNLQNMTRRPKPKLREDGNGYARNNAAAKGGLNKSFYDAGLGQIVSMLEIKMKRPDREFKKVPPQYTSQTCPNCGNVKQKSLSQRTHLCECGCLLPRDVAAAKIILARADFARSYSACAEEVTPGTTSVVVTTVVECPDGHIEPGIAPVPLEVVTQQLSIPFDVEVLSNPSLRKSRKRRSYKNPSQIDPEQHTQLGLWGTG